MLHWLQPLLKLQTSAVKWVSMECAVYLASNTKYYWVVTNMIEFREASMMKHDSIFLGTTRLSTAPRPAMYHSFLHLLASIVSRATHKSLKSLNQKKASQLTKSMILPKPIRLSISLSKNLTTLPCGRPLSPLCLPPRVVWMIGLTLPLKNQTHSSSSCSHLRASIRFRIQMTRTPTGAPWRQTKLTLEPVPLESSAKNK